MKRIVSIFSILALSSCINIHSTLRVANGPIEERIIPLTNNITALAASNGADIIVDPTLPTSYIHVTTHSDIFDILNVEEKDNTLHIGLEPHTLSAKTFLVRIPVFAYNEIALSGGCDFIWNGCIAEELSIITSGGADVELSGKCDKLSILTAGGSDTNIEALIADSVNVNASGGADIEITGICKSLHINASGGTDVDLKELLAEVVNVSASGGADVMVHASKSLSINSSGGADVSYTGSPASTNINTSGGADVSRDF